MKHRILGFGLMVGGAAVGGTASAQPRVPIEVDVGWYHACTTTSCGDVTCWGLDDDGQSADRSTVAGPGLGIVYNAARVGLYHTCALDFMGRVECWGDDRFGQSSPPNVEFYRIDAGGLSTCGIRDSDRALQCWGDIAPPNAPGRFKEISVGEGHACAVREDSTEVVCWATTATARPRISI